MHPAQDDDERHNAEHSISFTTENAGVEIAEVDRTGGKCRSGKCKSKSYGTPNRNYFERILSYLNLVR